MATFVDTLIYFRPISVGIVYPLFTVLSMIGVYYLKQKLHPSPSTPDYIAIQHSIIIGGLLSVILTSLYSWQSKIQDLMLGGAIMALLAGLSIAIENFRSYRELNAAQRAANDAEDAKRLADDGHLGAALEALQDLLLTTEKAYGSFHPQVALIVTYLADTLNSLEHKAAATLMFERAVKIYEAIPEHTGMLLKSLGMLSTHLQNLGQSEQALAIAHRALQISQQTYEESATTAGYMLTECRIHVSLKRFEEANKLALKAKRILEHDTTTSKAQLLKADGIIASTTLKLGRLAEAERLLYELVAQREAIEASNPSSDYLDSLLDLSQLLKAGKHPEANSTFQKTLEIFRVWVGPKYLRASEIYELAPAYLAPDDNSGLQNFYTVLFSAEPSGCRQLLRDKPSIAQEVDHSGWTPLIWACFQGASDLVNDLISRGADISHGRGKDYPALYIAARWARHRAISNILRSEREVDIDIDTLDSSRPLHGAVRSGSQPTFDILISNQASVNATNAKGWTALHEAAYQGERKFLVRLISEGADVNFQAPPHYDTPLHAAVKGNSWITTETLIINLAKDSLANSDGLLPIQLAAQKSRRQVVEILQAHVSPAAANILNSPAKAN